MRKIFYFPLSLCALLFLSGNFLLAQSPVIDGQNTFPATDEDTPIELDINYLDVTDDDSPNFPEGFTLVIKPGVGYTFSDLTVTPDPNVDEQITVTVEVLDPDMNPSGDFGFVLGINPVNDPPVIAGQVNTNVEIAEETSLTIETTDLIIQDADAGDVYTLVIEEGDNYTASGNQITPDEDYFGPLVVNLYVNDGTVNSNIFGYQVTVINENDPPTLDLVSDVALTENGPSGDAMLSGITSGAANEDQTLTVTVEGTTNPGLFDGSPVVTYTSPDPTGTITFTPAADMTGDAVITVRVSDGMAFAEQTFTVTVNAMADPLLITGQDAVSMNEDDVYTILVSDLTIQGGDEPSALTVNATSGPNYVAAGSVITPSPNFSGTLVIPVTVSDGSETSPSFDFVLEVNAVNDAPTIAPVADVTMDEDAAQITIPLTGITAGPLEDQTLQVTVSSDAAWLFETFALAYNSPDENGTLSVKPAANASGSAEVTVTVMDNGPGSAPHVNTVSTSFTIHVTPVNDPPLVTGQDAVSVDEDSEFTIEVAHLTIIDHDDDTDFDITVGSGDNYTFSGTTVVPNDNYFGTLTIPITVSDGNSPGTAYNFILAVNPINDAPTIVAPAVIDLDENAAETGFPLTGITAGPFEIQGLTLLASSDNMALFEVLAVEYDNPSTTGTLNVKPTPNMSGTASARVTVMDDGPDAPPNINTAFVDITINVNDVVIAPVITGQNTTPATDEETQIALNINHLDVDDPDNTFPTGFTLNVKPGAGYTVSGPASITPNAEVSGTIGVIVTVTDPDGMESDEWAFQVTVNAVNDPPVIAGQVNNAVTMNEDATLALTLADLVFTDPDVGDTHTLVIENGTNYTHAGNQITPLPNYFGPLQVNLHINDGTVNSNTYQYLITVNNVNDPPTLDPIANVTMDEDTGPLSVNLSGITPGPGETEAVTVTAVSDNTAVLPDPMVTYSGGTTGSLSLQPVADRSGTANVTVTVSDGSLTFAQVFVVTVTEVNDLPTLDPIADVIVAESSLLPVVETVNLTGITDGSINEAQELSLSISVSNDNSGLFLTVLPVYLPGATTGSIVITPNVNVSGSATFTVTVSDGVDDFSQQFLFTITEVNDPPSFDVIADVTVVEDAGPQAVAIAGVSAGPGETQDITFTAVSSNPTLIPDPVVSYTQGSATASLAYTPATNRWGTTTITVTAEDEDGADFSRDFVIEVTAVNDAPTIAAIADVDILEDAALTPIALAGIGAGPLETQVITVTAAAADPSLFETFEVVYTTPGATGSLNVKPALNKTGSTLVTVTVADDGPGTAPDVNTTTTTFTINITPVNDPPVITAQAVVSVNEDNNFTIGLGHVTIEDPDNTSGFTLTVTGPGANYTHSGNTITPAADFYGQLTIPITVSDGTASSAPFNFVLTVNPVNDAPVITGQEPIVIDEGESFELTFDVLHVTDADPEDIYPDDFSIIILSGPEYSVLGTTITPVSNFNGPLQVPIIVNDGTANSAIFTLNITVDAVNDPPVITGQPVALTIDEDQSVVLSLAQLTIVDPDNVPADFTLVVQPGANYTFSGLTVTPATNFNGPLQVTVVVNDGELNSAPFNMLVTVNPVNDPPVITGQNPVTTTEDTPVTISLADLVVVDPDADDPYPGTFTMTALPGANYTLDGLTVTPALDYTGTLSVPVFVNDGDVNSNTFNLQIQVTDENDVPEITGQEPLSTEEDTPVTILFSHLTVVDTDNVYPDDFTIVIQSGTNYTYSGTTITPALDFTGTLIVNLRVNDGLNNSARFPFEITVLEENDPPVITGQKALSVAEDTPITIQFTDLTVTDPDPEDVYPTGFTMTLAAGTNYTVDGTTVHPAPNYFGPLTVPVTVNDGQEESAPFNLVITVTPVNDPPSLNPIDNVIIPENTEDYAVQITGISAGPLENQTLIVQASSSNEGLLPPPQFSPAYAGGPTATILLNPLANKTGTVTVTITVIDPGLLEASQTFTVQVENINDPPTLNPIVFDPIPEDSPEQTISLTGISAGPGESQVLTVTATSDKPGMFANFEVTYTSPQTTGTLTFLPSPDAFGTVTVSVTVTDDGSNVAPHVNFITREFTLEITPVPDPPVFLSEPVEIALIGEEYEYLIDVVDTDPGAVITLEAAQVPGWLTLTELSNGKGSLKGSPPPGSSGQEMISLKATDDTDTEVFQNYTLIVDARPVVSDFSITAEEDEPRVIEKLRFDAAFQDADNDMIQAVKIVKLPPNGQLFVGTQAVNVDQEISAAALATLTYKGLPDYHGRDTIVWNAYDGWAYAAAPANIFVTITPVNDPPVIVALESDVLTVNAGEGPVEISTEFEVVDVDNEFLTRAEIGFRRENFVAEEDLLMFDDTPKITGEYEGGVLTLTGTATVAEYNAAIRSVKYDNVSAVFSSQEINKTIFYAVSDGQALSATRDRVIKLIDTFEELTIPNGFTPNSDGSNDRWLITNLNRHADASVRIYTIMGQIIYASDGIYEGWDGTYNGELLPTDTYYYTIDLNLPFRKKVYKGAVTILR